MIKALFDMTSRVLLLMGLIFVVGSIFSLLGAPFYTRWDDWSKHSSQQSFVMIRDGFFLIAISLIYFKFTKSNILLIYNPTTKCPKCKEVFSYKDTIEGKCPYCQDVDTIDIKEYYKMFPDEKKSDL